MDPAVIVFNAAPTFWPLDAQDPTEAVQDTNVMPTGKTAVTLTLAASVFPKFWMVRLMETFAPGFTGLGLPDTETPRSTPLTVVTPTLPPPPEITGTTEGMGLIVELTEA